MRIVLEQWPLSASGLWERGVFAALTFEQLIGLPGGPLLKGAFSERENLSRLVVRIQLSHGWRRCASL
jgi:hypothetical protein